MNTASYYTNWHNFTTKMGISGLFALGYLKQEVIYLGMKTSYI